MKLRYQSRITLKIKIKKHVQTEKLINDNFNKNKEKFIK